MSHARIEEVEDSDVASDPSEADISDVASDFSDRDIIKAKAAPSRAPPPNAKAAQINPSNIPFSAANAQITTAPDGTMFKSTEDSSKYKDFQCIYPIYFDATRSRAEGRRVGKKLAVKNPIAREIVAACSRLRIETLFEPLKTHPKDWANPGRVKVNIKSNPAVKNSMSYPEMSFTLEREDWTGFH
jgi:signal recognition particle subunit SRP19